MANSCIRILCECVVSVVLRISECVSRAIIYINAFAIIGASRSGRTRCYLRVDSETRCSREITIFNQHDAHMLSMATEPIVQTNPSVYILH